MKIEYINSVERKFAFFRKRRCPCGCKYYLIINQIQPRVFKDWYVMCPQCLREGPEAPTRHMALRRWEGKE